MQTRTVTGVAAVCIALAATATATQASPGTVPANITYRIVQLSPTWAGGPEINAKGQVAFTEYEPTGTVGMNVSRAKFYDGNSVRDIGTLGGHHASIAALNDAGQVVGMSTVSATAIVNHAFRWSKETGMINLTPLAVEGSFASDINNRGWITGTIVFPGRRTAFRWTPQTGMTTLGTLIRGATGAALNDAGTVVGSGGNLDASQVAVTWPGTSPVLLKRLAQAESGASDINNAGQVVGYGMTSNANTVAVLWTQEGVLDLGLPTSLTSSARKINAKGLVIGNTFPGGLARRGFVWSPDNGPLILGSADVNTRALDLNNRGQVVGDINGRAFVWTREKGIVDLNTRIQGAPPDLLLQEASAISDNGTIVAKANTGLVLLVPGAAYHHPPVAGPVQMTGTPSLNALLSFSASFRDVDLCDGHKAVWSWGDGSETVGSVSGSRSGGNSVGSVSGQHAYTEAGSYIVRLTVTDSSGKRTTVAYRVDVLDTTSFGLT